MHAPHRDEPRGRRARERGSALALVFVSFTIAALLVAITGALVVHRTDDPAPAALAARRPEHPAADAAPSDAVQRVDATGVIDFRSDVIDDWSNRWGSTWHAAPRTAAAPDPRDPTSDGGALHVDQVRQSDLHPVEWRPVGYDRRERRVCTVRRLTFSGS
jgi:hypothetical protein